MTDVPNTPNTRHKAFHINQDLSVYGTIAEIGAGQEVGRQFFQAGGASKTVAKTLSAYDMQVSDAIYGVEKSGRYVTRARVESMLDTEYEELIKRVAESRTGDTRYFAFANTVAAKAYRKDRDWHGWMGIRFQPEPGATPCQVVVHMRMLDSSNRGQQEALGILGVNLIHGAFEHLDDPEKLVDAIVGDLEWGRIEIDFIHFSGPLFEQVDNRKMNLRLVTSSLGPVVMFCPNGEAGLPADLIFKKHVLILRGNFRPFLDVHADMVECGTEAFSSDLATSPKNVICFCEVNVARYLSEGLDEVSDLEARVKAITERGYHVMVTSHFRYFRLSRFFSRHAKRKTGFILSAHNVLSIFDDKFYEGMEGGVLEGLSKLFVSGSRLLVYPTVSADGVQTTADTLEVPENQEHLYQHLYQNGRIMSLHPDPSKMVPFVDPSTDPGRLE